MKKSQTRHNSHTHDHSKPQKRLNRIKGQVEAISRMMEEQKYCLDIIQQIRAASSALQALEKEILQGHLEVCVTQAMHSKDSEDVHEKIQEIIKIWK